MNLTRLLALSLFLLSPLAARAQLGLYGAFTVQNLGAPNNSGYGFYGGTVLPGERTISDIEPGS